MIESEDNLTFVGMAGSAREAIEDVLHAQPDVVLMDLRMPGMEGIEAITGLRAAAANARILVLTNYESDDYIARAMQAGALGYLLKSTPQDEIVKGIEMVARNERCVPPEIARRFIEASRREPLTERELEVLALVARGLTNKEIAQKLFISDKTARNHVANCLEKLCVNDRTEAATTAITRGLIRIAS
jgi:DNA-binding NarL/FixJ family response regulator